MERRTTLREEDQVILAPIPPVPSHWSATPILAASSVSSLMATTTTVGLRPFPSSTTTTAASAVGGQLYSSSKSSSSSSFGSLRTNTPPLTEELSLDGIFGFLGSSKQYRNPFGNFQNEDRIFLGKVGLSQDGEDSEAIFIGLYDGHGGAGKASAFVCEQMKTTFERIFKTIIVDEPLPDRIAKALDESFRIVDLDFHKKVKSEAVRANVGKKQKPGACCKYFNEDPCVCLNPPISANEGSTGTVVIITKSHVICANVGDSDAFVVERLGDEDDDDIHDNSSASPSSTGSTSTSVASLDDEIPPSKRTRLASKLSSSTSQKHVALTQITITDTPVPSESNEDYLRIRNIAQRSSSSTAAAGTKHSFSAINDKLPRDGILRNPRGERFNYVAVPGARSLNMVRAFGNLGNKKFVDDEIVETDSAIICRPHVKILPRTNRFLAIVLGSDGLWDNMERTEVASLVGTHMLTGNDKGTSSAKQCAMDLLQRAVESKKKPDDVSVVIVPL